MSTQNKQKDGHRQEGGVIEMYAGIGVQGGQAALCISAAGYIVEEGGAKCLDLFIVHKMDDDAIREANASHSPDEKRWSSLIDREFKFELSEGKIPIVLSLTCVKGQQPYAIIKDAYGNVTSNSEAPAGSTLPCSVRTRPYILAALNRYAGYEMFAPLHPETARAFVEGAKEASRERRKAKRAKARRAAAKAKAKVEAIASGKQVVQYNENSRVHTRKVTLYSKDGRKVDTAERWGWQEDEKKEANKTRKPWQSPASHSTRMVRKKEGNVALAFREAGV